MHKLKNISVSHYRYFLLNVNKQFTKSLVPDFICGFSFGVGFFSEDSRHLGQSTEELKKIKFVEDSL